MNTILKNVTQENFTTLPNELCQRTDISYRSLGLLVNLLSRPPDWVVQKSQLTKGGGREGKGAVQASLNELQEAGLIFKHRVRNEDGTFNYVWYVAPDAGSLREYLIHEGLLDVSPEKTTVEPRTENRTTDTGTTVTRNYKRKNTKEREQTEITQGNFSPDDWQYKGASMMYDFLDEEDILSVLAKRPGKESTLQKWADVLDKLHRLDKFDKNDIAITLLWLRDAKDLHEDLNGARWWYNQGNFNSIGTLRNKTRAGDKLKFEIMLRSATDWYKSRKKTTGMKKTL